MPKPSKKPLAWSRVLEGAERLDERYNTTRYGNAVICKMLERVAEKRAAPKKVYLLVRRSPALMTPLQEKMAWRRKMAYR